MINFEDRALKIGINANWLILRLFLPNGLNLKTTSLGAKGVGEGLKCNSIHFQNFSSEARVLKIGIHVNCLILGLFAK